ncbi:MAG TPA: phenylacetic acid degradation protein PaaN, partial [Mycobacteriales bacterium]|nr:phenylacetic acid degradation protein PaaN [Mycobacteriales bacterium]
MTGTGTAQQFVDRHRETLERALSAIRERGYWSAFPESPSPRVYGEGAAEAGKAAYEAHLGRRFELGQAGTVGWVGSERSPYGPELGVRYPKADLDALLASAQAAIPAWRDAGPEVRAAVCVEIVTRINARSFEIANAVMHTSGQAFVMAFQAGGPHAQDRALEAVAYALAEQTRVPATARWEKPQGKRPPQVMVKTFTVVPRGVGLVVGCSTFPTWNSYPGLFASLVTGNAVVVKPHPRAVLPLAITVAIARDVLAEAGFARDLITLVAEEPGERTASGLATRPEVRIVDFTGSTAYGDWLEDNARQAQVYTEKAGVNAVVIDSTDDYAGMLANLAFSLSLYSGQMCTTPQDLLMPRDGIGTELGRKSVDEVAADLGAAVDKLLGADAQAVEVLGAIVSDDVLARLDGADSLGEVVVPSRAVTHPAHPDARVRTPAVVRVSADGSDAYATECFGPVAFLVTTDSTGHSLDVFRRIVGARGALTASVYSTDDKVVAAAREAALDSGVALSENLTAGVYVNQSAAFSD